MKTSPRKHWGFFLPMAVFLLLAAPAAVFAQAPAAETAPAGTVPSVSLYADAPPQDLEMITVAKGIAAKGKWLTAWNILSTYDPDNSNPFVVAAKIELALEGYAQTSLHVVFGFSDLSGGQTLDDLRSGMSEGIQPVDFAPTDVVREIEAAGGAMPPVLSLALGDYYYVVWKEYPGQWILEDNDVLTYGAEAYDRALAYDVFTKRSLARHSEILHALRKYDGAELVTKKALELDPSSGALHLRLADIYLAAGKPELVYAETDIVMAAPDDPNLLGDAYVLAISAGLAEKNPEILEKYVAAYEKSFPEEFIPGLVRHLVAVRMEDEAGADAAADAVTEANPGNPEIIRSLLSTWLAEGKADKGMNYIDRMIAKKPADNAMAAFYFYRALLDAETAESVDGIKQALADLAMAEEYFLKSPEYPAGSQVYDTIASLKEEWSAIVAPPAIQEEAPAATPPEGGAPAGTPAETPPATPPDASSGTTN